MMHIFRTFIESLPAEGPLVSHKVRATTEALPAVKAAVGSLPGVEPPANKKVGAVGEALSKQIFGFPHKR